MSGRKEGITLLQHKRIKSDTAVDLKRAMRKVEGHSIGDG